MADRWWENARPWLTCYHPRADRHMVGAWSERCGHCGELRYASEPFVRPTTPWPPVTKNQKETAREWAARMGTGRRTR